MRATKAISRRAVLRGAGVAMALPWLESLHGATPFPKRFAVLFMGNGINDKRWEASGQGSALTLKGSLEVLEPIQGKVNVIDGLFLKMATGQGIHPAQTGSLLSGASIAKGPIIQAGRTIDQVIANAIGQETAQQSLVLACEQPMTGYHETNFSMAYSSHISWQTADSPVPNEVYPSLAWDSLFENRGSLRNLSILDRVKERASELGRRVSATDKAKLDEYLTSVREVERRIERTRTTKEAAEDKAKGLNKPAWMMERPENGLPEDLREHARLMCDIIAIAFQTDKTRVATLLLARDLSALYYPWLNVKEGHHAASHDNLTDGYDRITRFHLGQLTYLAQKLEAMPEGEGTVLDHSCLMWLNNLWSGSKHDNTRLPVVLAGGMGGELETGRALNYLGAGDEKRKLCSLYLSLMDKMGVKLPRFGDAEERLHGI